MTFEQWWNSDPTRAGMTESHPAKMGARDGWNAGRIAEAKWCQRYVSGGPFMAERIVNLETFLGEVHNAAQK